MKKNILSAMSLLLVFSFLFGFAACTKGGDDSKTTVKSYITDENGTTKLVELVTDADGEIEHFVNAEGETEVAYVDRDTGETVHIKENEVSTTVEVVSTKKNDKKNDKTTTAGEGIANATTNPLDAVPTTMISDGTLPADNATTIKVELGPDGNPVTPQIQKSYQEIIDSGKYTMYCMLKTTTQGETTSFPLIMAVNGDKLFVEAKPPESEGISMNVQFISDGSKYYLVIPKMLAYCEVSADELKSILPTQAELDEADGTYVSTTEVSFDGKNYICETYKTDDGTVKQYYQSNALKRIETINDNGDVSIIDITYLSPNVSNNLFVLPSNYIPLNDLADSFNAN